MTRGEFYARRYGGGLRTARKERKCEQFGCFKRIAAGEQYFDTMLVWKYPLTTKICTHCANKTI